jgi:hypothetical protein
LLHKSWAFASLNHLIRVTFMPYAKLFAQAGATAALAACLLLPIAVSAQALPSAASAPATGQVSSPAEPSAADKAIENALSKIPIDAMLSQLLSSIDIGALAAQAEKSIVAAASGKAPETATSERERAAQERSAQEAQAKISAAMQKQFATFAPELIRGLFAMVTPMLAELRSELASEFKASTNKP